MFLRFSIESTIFIIFSINQSHFSPYCWFIGVYTAVAYLHVRLSTNCRVLLVEDEMDLMQLYQAALNASGIQVDGFTDPLKAYSRFQENSDNYDVIISDIRMPGLSGIQLAQKLKEIKKDVKVFLMSAYDMTGAD